MSQNEKLQYNIWVGSATGEKAKVPMARVPRITAADIAEHGVSWPQLAQTVIKQSRKNRYEKMKNLVIVESPTKSRTLQKFLGADYRIEASMGHIRDLPKAEMGIDIDHNFEPNYIIPRDKKKRVNELKKLGQSAETVWLASDPDREGEAIAWHIKELLSDKKAKLKDQNFRRVEFHEITESAVKQAFQHPRELNLKLVDAQQARRVLDRLVGYKLSPLLWKKVKRGLSAGRVQSVAVRLVVEREREIQAFKPVEYWSIEALLESTQAAQFWASLVALNGQKIEVGSQVVADQHLANLKVADYSIEKITKKQVKKNPAPPFTTSTLQQAAGNRLGFSAKKTMSVAQYLYEQGFITYMRTDSLNLAPAALAEARVFIEQQFGKDYLPASSRVFKLKSKSAQEAHEAIRPTNIKLKPEALQMEGMTRDHLRLYELIWKRMLASQMAEALVDQTTVEVRAVSSQTTDSKQQTGNSEQVTGDSQDKAMADDSGFPPEARLAKGGMIQDSRVTSHQLATNSYTLRATGSIVKFDGWLKLYGVKGQESGVKEEEEGTEGEEGSKNQILPELVESENLNLLDLKGLQHFTEPPPRFNEASLIKKLEELGIGRPSTYAPTLSTIQDRFYVERKERKFFPTALGMAVTDFLVKNFPEIVDYSFTAQMEGELDQIAEGKRAWQPTIKQFYQPFAKKLELTETKAERVKLEAETVDKPCPKCGKPLIIRYGKFGKFLACSGFPECKHTEPFEQIIDVSCPKDGGQIVLRRTKSGRPFYGCKNYPKCEFASWSKPTVSKQQAAGSKQ